MTMKGVDLPNSAQLGQESLVGHDGQIVALCSCDYVACDRTGTAGEGDPTSPLLVILRSGRILVESCDGIGVHQ